MVSSSTIVHQSMELWPVYRAATVNVNSNIDDVIPEGQHENYRSLSRLGSIDSVALVAEAQDFPGYQFDHWATGYIDDGNQGNPVTENSNFVLRAASRSTAPCTRRCTCRCTRSATTTRRAT